MYLLKCQDKDRALPILLKRIRYMREKNKDVLRNNPVSLKKKKKLCTEFVRMCVCAYTHTCQTVYTHTHTHIYTAACHGQKGHYIPWKFNYRCL